MPRSGRRSSSASMASNRRGTTRSPSRPGSRWAAPPETHGGLRLRDPLRSTASPNRLAVRPACPLHARGPMVAFDVEALRRRFPALAIEDRGRPVALFDGPGGTQVPDTVIAAIGDYYRTSNANHGGPFLTSRRSHAIAH